MSEHEPGTEQATEQRRQQLRKRGDVPVSRELATAGSVVVLAAFVSGALPALGQRIAAMMKFQLGLVGERLPVEPMRELLHALFVAAQSIGWMLGGAALLLGGVAFIGASACVSSERFAPRAERLDPVAGLKRMLSVDALIAAARGLLLAGLLTGSALWAMRDGRHWLTTGSSTPIEHAQRFAHHLLARSTWTLALVLLGLAGLDVIIVRWRYERRIRMSREDVRQEVKEHEGDPMLRARRRRRQRELLKGSVGRAMLEASVVVANPTHVAVALRYRQGIDAAPRVVAKGIEQAALRIRALAVRNGVPVIEQRELARALLGSVSVGQLIPSRLYRAVAVVLAHVQRMSGARQVPPSSASPTSARLRGPSLGRGRPRGTTEVTS